MKKDPDRRFGTPVRTVDSKMQNRLKQMEFFSAADGSPAVVHPQLGVNVLGVGPDCAQREHALTGDFWAAHFGPEQPQNVQLALA